MTHFVYNPAVYRMSHEDEPASAQSEAARLSKSKTEPLSPPGTAEEETPVAKALPIPVDARTVFARLTVVENRLQKLAAIEERLQKLEERAQRRRPSSEEKAAREREVNREACRRYRERNLDELRQKDAARKRAKRAQERGQDGAG